MKKASAFFIALLLAFSFSFSSANAQGQDIHKIVIFHTNDTHARVVEGEYDGMGFPKIKAIVKSEKESNPNVLLLDAGDTFHGQPIATLDKGESIAAIMNEMGYDAMAPGNHDFNYGYEQLVKLDDMTGFPILACNISTGNGENIFTPYIIKEIDGLKIGIFGMATPETTYKSNPANTTGLTFEDPVESAAETVKYLEPRTDAIIAVSHLGLDEQSSCTSESLAASIDGIDVIIDGHSHSVLVQGKLVNGTLIASAGEYNKNLGKVVLEFNGNNLISKEGSLITKQDASNVVPDEGIESAISSIQSSQSAVLDQVVASTPVTLDGEREDVRTGETNLGDIITDSMRLSSGAEISMLNGGAIRSSIDSGEITKREITAVLPFGNYIVTKRITGNQIVEALEHGTSSYPEQSGSFLHVSGMSYKIDMSRPTGARIVDVMVGGSPVQPEKSYLTAVNDFMAAGGDAYDMFKTAPIEGEFGSLDEILIGYMQNTSDITFSTQSRILAMEAPQPESPTFQPETPYADRYVVIHGDTLWKIAKIYNTSWQKLSEANRLKNPDLIFPGQVLSVP